MSGMNTPRRWRFYVQFHATAGLIGIAWDWRWHDREFDIGIGPLLIGWTWERNG